jgi:Tfp pilus assembly protein PilP
MKNQKKLGYLLLLVFLWGALTIYQWMDSDDPGAETANLLLTQADSGNPALPPLKELLLDKQFPNARQTVKLGQPRNIFASLEEQAAKLASRNSTQTKSMEHSNTSQAAEPPPPPPPPPGPSPAELAAQRARQELNRFRFLGFLKKGGESQAFISNGQAIYIVRQGEILEGRIQVNKIEPETVILSTKVWETGSSIQASISLTPDTRS